MHTHLSAREGDSLLSRSTIHELDMPKALEPAREFVHVCVCVCVRARVCVYV